jgi:hypothetical protein
VKATIENGEICLDLQELVNSLSEEHLRELAQAAVFQESLLNGVCDALADSTMFDGWWWGGDTFDNLRAKLLPLMPDVMAEAIRRLTEQRDTARRRADAYRRALWELQRAWHDAKRPRDVQVADYLAPPPMTKEQAREYVEKVIADAEAVR